MSDEIQDRLKNSTEKCLKAYEAWRKDEKNAGARETLQDSVHELRKVASRLEIELAVSDRKNTTQKPMPIPPHRDARGKGRGKDDADGNSVEQSRPAKPQRLAVKKAPPAEADEE
ncbi:MAG: hypothetical protein KDI11_03740 [Alphaproteobacteria bacterium]|nr:hypothetical protein [Alphaproteobacteria bacterium]